MTLYVWKRFGEEHKNTMRYVISKDVRWQLRDMLDKVNMNERSMFPGLDGLQLGSKGIIMLSNTLHDCQGKVKRIYEGIY